MTDGRRTPGPDRPEQPWPPVAGGPSRRGAYPGTGPLTGEPTGAMPVVPRPPDGQVPSSGRPPGATPARGAAPTGAMPVRGAAPTGAMPVRGAAPTGAVPTRGATPTGLFEATRHPEDDPFAPVAPRGRRPETGPGRAPVRPPVRKRFIDYPRAGRRGFTRWIPSWRLVGAFVLLGMFTVVGAFVGKYATTEVPDVKSSTQFQTTTVTFRNKGDATIEMGRFAVENRTIVPLSEIPDHMQKAVLAAEDRSFESNSGVSPTGIVRAAWNNLRGGARQGGSTITQQYVKNGLYANPNDRSIGRKVDEFFISLKVSREYSKTQILGDYLNTIYFGRGAYGVEAASKAWFGKSVKELRPHESAFLAGIINGPELYDPITEPKQRAAAQKRQKFVLDGMVAEGWMSAERRRTMAFPTYFRDTKKEAAARGAWGSQKQYMMAMVRAEAKKMGYTDEQIDHGGLKIETTFDAQLVGQAVISVNVTLGSKAKWPKGTQASLVSIDHRTGAIRAIYGGDGTRQQNAASQDIAEAGSTFKPFGLVAALEGDRQPGDCKVKPSGPGSVSLRTEYDGKSPLRLPEFGERGVSNFGGAQFGRIDLLKATANSVNTVFAQLNKEVGPDHTLAVALCAGIPESTPDLGANPANILGTSSPTIKDMATAFATFANKGTYNEPYVITKITSPTGETLHKAAPEERFDVKVMADAVHAMEQPVLQGTATWAKKLKRPIAGKTGTSTDNKSAWFVGFDAARLSTAVALYRIGPNGAPQSLVGWDGGRDAQFKGKEISGGTFPTRLWTEFMERALGSSPAVPFPEPAWVGTEPEPSPSPSPSVSATPSESLTPPPPPTVEPSPSPTADPSLTPEPSLPEPTDTPSPDPSLPTPEPSDPDPDLSPPPSEDPVPTPSVS